MAELEGKVAIVTGSGRGIGKAVAKVFAREGAKVVVASRTPATVEAVAQEIRDEGHTARGVPTDVSQKDQILAMVATTVEHYGTVDILINNAANNPSPSEQFELNERNFRLENFPMEQWVNDLSIGLTGAFLCAKHYGNIISKNINGGSIVNISSDLGLISPDQSLYRKDGLHEDQQPVKPITYSVIKHGIIGMTKYLATYWADKGIRVNTISPGGVYTNQPDEFVSRISELIPLGRMASEDEYKAAIVFLCSDASSYMTGSNLVIDGGRTCL